MARRILTAVTWGLAGLIVAMVFTVGAFAIAGQGIGEPSLPPGFRTDVSPTTSRTAEPTPTSRPDDDDRSNDADDDHSGSGSSNSGSGSSNSGSGSSNSGSGSQNSGSGSSDDDHDDRGDDRDDEDWDDD